MSRNKAIIKYCPNFNKIINFDYSEGDFLTENLINVYNDYIFSPSIKNEQDIKNIVELDRILATYIDDYYFRAELRHGLQKVKISKGSGNILETIVNAIFKIFNLYEEGSTRKIYITRWI